MPHTIPTPKDMRSSGEHAVPDGAPLTEEETFAMAWLDGIFATDLDARIGRMRWTDDATGLPTGRPVWTFKFAGPHNWFVGQDGETLRALILHAYRSAINADS